MKKLKSPRRAKLRERASKIRLGEAVHYKQPPLRKPEGEMKMLLEQMRNAELEAQVQAETGTKLRHRVVQLIKARRLAGNISVDVMAAAISRNRVSLVRIERGTRVPTDGTLSKMLTFIGVDWTPTAIIFTSQAKIEKRLTE